MIPRIKTCAFDARDLLLVLQAPPPDVPPLMIGDYCRLNSGGPDCLVVAASGDEITFAWKDGEQVAEHTLPRGCVRRIES